MSVARSFTTAPVGARPFRVDAFADQGDCRSNRAACRVISGIVADHLAFVLGSGDLSYANEHGLESWDRWFNAVQAYAADVPLMPTMGNHEFPAGDPMGKYTDPITSYQGRFALPPSHGEDYYSFDYAGTHVIALPEIYVRTRPGSPFRRWLQDDLTAADSDPAIRWKIAFSHRPFYSSGTKHGSYRPYVRDVLPILERHHVDLVISGHEHNYERTRPLRGGVPSSHDVSSSVQGTGTSYVVTGGGGKVLDRFGITAHRSP